MKLLLFDIDGTILLTHGIGRKAVEATLSRVYGVPFTTKGVVFHGKTDPQILREVLHRHGIDAASQNDRFEEALGVYTDVMTELLETAPVTTLPGVPVLIEALHRVPDLQLALLTGNLQPIAYRKLEVIGLADYFPFGAFGSDREVRSELPPVAVERARAHTGRDFSGKEVVIIGDTEHDITCGRGIGAFSVGVCTGNYKRADLHLHEPDLVLDDLSDLAFFRKSVLGLPAGVPGGEPA